MIAVSRKFPTIVLYPAEGSHFEEQDLPIQKNEICINLRSIHVVFDKNAIVFAWSSCIQIKNS